jgi:hypothetical protein
MKRGWVGGRVNLGWCLEGMVQVKWRGCQDEGKGEIMVSLYIYT